MIAPRRVRAFAATFAPRTERSGLLWLSAALLVFLGYELVAANVAEVTSRLSIINAPATGSAWSSTSRS